MRDTRKTNEGIFGQSAAKRRLQESYPSQNLKQKELFSHIDI